MWSRKTFERDGLRTFVLVLAAGDEAFEEISAFARAQRVTGASLVAVGACREATLGWFDPGARDYCGTSFTEQMEVLSLIGDIALQDGEPALHAHLVLGRRDSSAIGGHLRRAVVFPTMEVVVTETPAHLRKRVDPRTGLALIAPDAS